MSFAATLLLPLLLLGAPHETSSEAERLNAEGIQLYDKKEFAKALPLFRRAAALSPKSEVIRQNVGRCLLEIGTAKLREEELVEATEILEEALKLLPGAGEAHYRLGVALHRQKELREAIRRLEHAVRLEPGHAHAHFWLGRAYYDAGYRDNALSSLEEAVRLNPKDSDMVELLERARRESRVEKDFVRERSSHFSIDASGEVSSAVREAVRRNLEDAYSTVASLLDYYPSDDIPAILYSEKEFRDVTQSHEWVGGVFDGKIRIPVKDFERKREAIERVVQHEVAHAILRGACSDVPIWFNEGWAQYLDGSDRTAADRAAAESGAKGEIPNLAEMGKALQGRDRAKVARAYAHALSFVSFLSRKHGEDRFSLIVRLARDGRTFEGAFAASYRSSPAVQAERWAETFGQRGG